MNLKYYIHMVWLSLTCEQQYDGNNDIFKITWAVCTY